MLTGGAENKIADSHVQMLNLRPKMTTHPANPLPDPSQL
jgi:hypothetical protein